MILVPGKGKDVLVDLINQQNVLPYPLLPDDVLFSPVKIVPGPLPTAVNSMVFAAPNAKYEGMALVQWDRMDLTSAFGDIVPRVSGLSNGNLHSMLPYIGQELGLELDAEDFEQVDYSYLNENEEINIQLKATVTSLSYRGSFVIMFTRLRPKLIDQVKVKHLDIYKWPGEATPPKARTVDMYTYSIDWSEHRDILAKHYFYNLVAYPTEMRALMLTHGFANWPVGWDNPYFDLPTSAVPEANQDYERVFVQVVKDVPGHGQILDYSGRAYFHYNLT